MKWMKGVIVGWGGREEFSEGMDVVSQHWTCLFIPCSIVFSFEIVYVAFYHSFITFFSSIYYVREIFISHIYTNFGLNKTQKK